MQLHTSIQYKGTYSTVRGIPEVTKDSHGNIWKDTVVFTHSVVQIAYDIDNYCPVRVPWHASLVSLYPATW